MEEKNVCEYQPVQCIALRKTGMSYRAIGSSVGMFRASVQHLLKRFETTDEFQDCPLCGRPKK